MYVPLQYSRAFVVASTWFLQQAAKIQVQKELPGLLEDMRMQIGETLGTDTGEETTTVR